MGGGGVYSSVAPYAALWMLTLRPDGSAAQPQSPRGIHLHRKNEVSGIADAKGDDAHRTAVSAAALDGNSPSKMSRMKNASLVSGVESGQRSARLAKSSSDTIACAWSLILSRVALGGRKGASNGGWRVPVYPGVAHAVGELLFLTPEDGFGQVGLPMQSLASALYVVNKLLIPCHQGRRRTLYG